MARERSSSSGSAMSASGHPLSIKIYRLSNPSLLIAHDYNAPELPALPQPQLLLPKSSHPVYVGEEFKCLLSVKLRSSQQDGDDSTAGPVETGNANDQDDDDDDYLDGAFLRAEVEAPDGARSELLARPIRFTREQPWQVEPLAFELSLAGSWTLRTSVRYNSGPEERTLRRVFRVEATPAISMRTKVSRAAVALKAHVLEAQIENLTDSPIVIESCVLNAINGWEVTAPSANVLSETSTDEEESTGGGIVLRPRDVNQWSFVLRNGWAREAGPLAITWRREPLGTKGWQTTGQIRI